MDRKRAGEHAKTVFQVVAILMLAGIVLMVLHKAWTDMGALAQANRGGDFLPALLRYVFRNLAGG